jgi:hypothetical protein
MEMRFFSTIKAAMLTKEASEAKMQAINCQTRKESGRAVNEKFNAFFITKRLQAMVGDSSVIQNRPATDWFEKAGKKATMVWRQ